jgi:hypothetical protein
MVGAVAYLARIWYGIIKMIKSFKEYCADLIAFVNQTAVPAIQHS